MLKLASKSTIVAMAFLSQVRGAADPDASAGSRTRVGRSGRSSRPPASGYGGSGRNDTSANDELQKVLSRRIHRTEQEANQTLRKIAGRREANRRRVGRVRRDAAQEAYIARMSKCYPVTLEVFTQVVEKTGIELPDSLYRLLYSFCVFGIANPDELETFHYLMHRFSAQYQEKSFDLFNDIYEYQPNVQLSLAKIIGRNSNYIDSFRHHLEVMVNTNLTENAPIDVVNATIRFCEQTPKKTDLALFCLLRWSDYAKDQERAMGQPQWQMVNQKLLSMLEANKGKQTLVMAGRHVTRLQRVIMNSWGCNSDRLFDISDIHILRQWLPEIYVTEFPNAGARSQSQSRSGSQGADTPNEEELNNGNEDIDEKNGRGRRPLAPDAAAPAEAADDWSNDTVYSDLSDVDTDDLRRRLVADHPQMHD